jgi:hypothetical protein
MTEKTKSENRKIMVAKERARLSSRKALKRVYRKKRSKKKEGRKKMV